MRKRCAAALFALILAGGNAGSEPSYRPDPKTVAAADNAFGLNLLHALDPDSAANVAISPTSIALVLQIVYNGARGATRQAMSRVLRLGSLSARDINFDNLALLASLKDPDSQVKLTIANSLWINLSKHPLLPAFVDVNRKYYEAHIGDLVGAPRNVNAWVSKETQGLITQILSEVQEDDVAVIANAIYFKGTWTAPFDPARTAAGEFSTSDGTKLMCQMMNKHDTFGYFRGANFEALRLRYGQNKRLSMLILLPDASTSLKAFMVGRKSGGTAVLDVPAQARLPAGRAAAFHRSLRSLTDRVVEHTGHGHRIQSGKRRLFRDRGRDLSFQGRTQGRHPGG
jgi:serpin B